MEITASGILSRMFEMTKARFGALFGLWAVYFVAQIAFSIVFFMIVGLGALAGGAMANPDALAGIGAGMIAMIIVFYVLYLLIYVASYASLTHMSSPLLQPTFGESFNAGFRSSLPLLGAMVLLLIGYLVVALVFSLLAMPLAALGSAGSIILAILFVPALIYIGCRLSIVFPLVAVDNIRNPITAIARSWSQTAGNVLSIVGAMVVYLVVTVVLFGLILGPLFLSADAMTDPAAGIGMMIYVFVGAIVATIIVTIMGAALASAIHGGLSNTVGETFE